jgi:hypothetical protein
MAALCRPAGSSEEVGGVHLYPEASRRCWARAPIPARGLHSTVRPGVATDPRAPYVRSRRWSDAAFCWEECALCGPILRCCPPLAGLINRTRGHLIQRRRRGPMVIRHPPGSGRMSTPSGSNRSYGSTKTSSSGGGIMRRSRRRGVGGTGGGALGSVLGSRVRTASRSASPWGTVAPHVSHVRPLLFTASHTRQRQTGLTGQPGP